MSWWRHFLVAGASGSAGAELKGPGHGPIKLATREPRAKRPGQHSVQPPAGLQLMGSWLSCLLKAWVA
eukprot:7464313-Pyramimonas_sp.AAC.1